MIPAGFSMEVWRWRRSVAARQNFRWPWCMLRERRRRGWDLNLRLVRGDLDDADARAGAPVTQAWHHTPRRRAPRRGWRG